MKKNWFLWLLILLLLPGNIFLAAYYFRTKRIANAKFPPWSEPEWCYQSLNPNFLIMGRDSAPVDDFWCIAPHNGVHMAVKDQRITQISGWTPQGDFSWFTHKKGFFLFHQQKIFVEFNGDYLPDFRSDADGSRWIAYQGKWLKIAKSVNDLQSAETQDGRRFQWNDTWHEMK